MSGPEFFQTQMGRQFYDSTMPAMAKALERIASAMEGKIRIDWDVVMTKESILHNASEDDLFALFHTFKEYYNQLQLQKEQEHDALAQNHFRPLDEHIGEVIKKLKAKYK